MTDPKFPFVPDMTKLFGEFKVPGVDVETILATQRRNIEALTRANQLAIEGFQTVARRQAEIVRGGIEEATALARDVARSRTPEDFMAYQTEAAKKALEQSLLNARELSEIATRAGNEAVDVLSQRLGETIDEARAIAAKKHG